MRKRNLATETKLKGKGNKKLREILSLHGERKRANRKKMKGRDRETKAALETSPIMS